MKKSFKSAKLFSLKLILPLIMFAFSFEVYSQSKGLTITPRDRRQLEEEKLKKNSVVFPDMYSDLDDKKAPASKFKTNEFNDGIEFAKQKYYQALILIQKRDTSRAARYFDAALEKLNQLSSTPGIEDNKEFTDLAQSIIDDYESYVKRIEFLDENSPIFIIRDLLFKELDVIEPLEMATPGSGNKSNDVTINNLPKLPKPPDSVQVPLDDHTSVDRGIQYLTKGPGKRFFTRWLERSSKWFPMMKRIAAEENMPQEIIYLSMIESGLNPIIVSPAKAVGLWQFMRATGEMYNLNKKGSIFIDERREPEKATRAAMRHLRDLYNEFGDWHLALAAYNCGAGCVARAIRKTNKPNPNYWDVRDNLPRETRGYVPQYIAATRIALDPVSFGFNLDSLEFHHEYKYETVSVDSAVNLSALAKAAEISLDSLREFNTELTKDCTPPDYLPYKLKLPLGKKSVFEKNYPNLTFEEKAPFITHIVDNRETVLSISKDYNVDASDIVSINRLSGSRHKLKKGMNLSIPVNGNYLDKLAKKTSSENRAVVEEQIQSAKNESVKHTVQRGETLYSIARKYEMDVAELRRLNSIDINSQDLLAGQVLWVKPIPAEVAYASHPNTANIDAKEKIIKHKVKRGETLSSIANKYSVTVQDIRNNNKISRSGKLKKGQNLKIITYETGNLSNNNKTPNAEKMTHKVKSGENLSTIANKYNVSEDELKMWNPQSVKGNMVYANTNLTIYSNTSPKSNPKETNNESRTAPKYYKIKAGDTLGEIAKKFGVSISSIQNLNKNIDEKSLRIGKQIRIN